MVLLNNNIDKISNYPFDRLRSLLSNTNTTKGFINIDLSIGQPYQKTPNFIKEIISSSFDKWHLYPPVGGIPELKKSYLVWVKRRFNISKTILDKNILPLAGSKEGLFSIALALAYTNIIIPNPFYQAYLGPSIVHKVNTCYLNTNYDNDYLFDLEKLEQQIEKKKSLVYFCSPSNPHGKNASHSYLKKLIEIIRKNDATLLVDECYIDIYTKNKPVGALKACLDSGKKLNNVLIFHTLSKRSNVAGLRSGFVIGDQEVIKYYKKLRSYSAPTIPIPLQLASAALWNDDKHVNENRKLYKEKFDYADKKLAKYKLYKKADAGFYLWLNVNDGEKFTKKLYKNYSIKVMPGEYLAFGADKNPGKNYVRVALVHDYKVCKFAIDKISELLSA